MAKGKRTTRGDVHHVQWQWPLDEHDRRRVAEFATSTDSKFKEIWIVNEYGDLAQRVPFKE